MPDAATLAERWREVGARIRELAGTPDPQDVIPELVRALSLALGHSLGGALLEEEARQQVSPAPPQGAARRPVLRRDDLVLGLTHRMKTPLTVLQGGVELLRNGPELPAPERAELLGSMHRQVRLLGRLVEQFLDVARLETGATVPPRLRPVAVADMLARVAERFAGMPGGVVVAVGALPAGLPPVRADPDLLEQVLDNVVDNAIRFSPPRGRVSLSARLVPAGVEVTVSDQGPGIDPSEYEQAFVPFHGGRGRAEGGHGLGLYIARTLAEAMGGSVRVARSSAAGTTIALVMPVAGGAAQPDAGTAEVAGSPDGGTDGAAGAGPRPVVDDAGGTTC